MSIMKVIYIEDEIVPRDMFKESLKSIYEDGIEIVTPDVERNISDMITVCNNYDNVAGYVIDEKLKISGEATYLGTDLAQAIRDIDSKIPVYILTSDASNVDNNLGSIEYIISKNDLSDRVQYNIIQQRLRRHLDIYNDIKSKRALRLEELLIKSMNEDLTIEENKEFEELNLIRMKPILLEESSESKKLKNDLDNQEAILKDIESKLNELG